MKLVDKCGDAIATASRGLTFLVAAGGLVAAGAAVVTEHHWSLAVMSAMCAAIVCASGEGWLVSDVCDAIGWVRRDK